MKRLTGIVSVLLVAINTIAILPTTSALAAEGDAKKCGDVETYFDWGCSGGNDSIIQSVLVTVLNWAAIGVSVAVVIGIVYGAITYASAGGNEANTKKAIEIIRNSIIALILYFGMYTILNFLIPGGLFT